MSAGPLWSVGDPRTAADAEMIIREFEHRFRPLDHLLGGWSVWCALRTDATVVVQQPPLRRGGDTVSPRALLRFAARDVARLASAQKADTVALTFTSGLADRRGDRFVDIWFDDLLDGLDSPNARTLKMESINSVAFLPRRARAWRKSAFTTAPIDFLSGARLRGTPSSGVRAVGAAIERDLQLAFGAEAFPTDWVTRRLQYFATRRALFRRLLGRVAPRVVLVADPGQHALVAAARESGARVAELQHGFIDGSAHPSYAWPQSARAWRHTMPVPDRLLVYGAAWERRLAVNGFWGDDVRVVGSARVDDHRAQRESVRAGARRAGARRVVVTGQGVAVADVAQWLRDALASRPDDDLDVVIKLHPVYESDPAAYAAALADPRVRVVRGTEEPGTFELLRDADAHVSIYSSCHLEALALGVPTIVLPLPGHEAMASLVAEGGATIAASPSELAGLWSRPMTTRAAAVAEDYFARGFAERASREVSELAALTAR